jgi:CBS domain-containing protein
MVSPVRTVGMEDTADQVEALLNEQRLSAVPVVDEQGAVFGILSAADLIHLHAANKNPKAVRAWELCTYKPVTVAPEVPVAEVARLMLERRIHHVPVVANGKVCGIVSSLDFVRQLTSGTGFQRES